jgi:hypothetical protein
MAQQELAAPVECTNLIDQMQRPSGMFVMVRGCNDMAPLGRRFFPPKEN